MVIGMILKYNFADCLKYFDEELENFFAMLGMIQ